jgi:hypothetical protein
VRRCFSLSALALLLALSMSATPASAQIGNVPGPGQPVARPAPQCPQTMSCTYDERTLTPAGYRFQSLTVCGADCTTQYWISSVADNKPLIEVSPTRGGGMIAVSLESDDSGKPAVRTVLPSYAGSDPACCPSSYVDTTYGWSAAQGTLVAGEPVTTPLRPDDQVDWVDAHDMLLKDGFIEVFGGP